MSDAITFTVVQTETPPVIKPTIRHNISFVAYAHEKAINWTTLKEMRKSPRHYAQRILVPLEDRASLLKGRAFHTATLEPERMALDYAVFDGKRKAGKLWERFRAEHAGKTLLSQKELSSVLRMRDAVMANKIAARYFVKGAREVTITWQDPSTGLPCKARPDLLAEIDGGTYLVDLKSAVDIDAKRFGSAAARYGYQCQLAWYARACDAVGIKLAGAAIIACESEAPHDVGVFTLDDDTMYAGDEECGELIKRVRECFDANDWHGRYAAEEPLQLPAWWYAQDDDAGDLGIIIHDDDNTNDEEV